MTYTAELPHLRLLLRRFEGGDLLAGPLQLCAQPLLCALPVMLLPVRRVLQICSCHADCHRGWVKGVKGCHLMGSGTATTIGFKG